MNQEEYTENCKKAFDAFLRHEDTTVIISEEINEGTFGKVYRAQLRSRPEIPRIVKLIIPSVQEEGEDRLENIEQIMGDCEHTRGNWFREKYRGNWPVYFSSHIFSHGGAEYPYLIREYISGLSLQQIIGGSIKVSPEETKRILRLLQDVEVTLSIARQLADQLAKFQSGIVIRHNESIVGESRFEFCEESELGKKKGENDEVIIAGHYDITADNIIMNYAGKSKKDIVAVLIDPAPAIGIKYFKNSSVAARKFRDPTRSEEKLPVDRSEDVFSLGVILHAIIEGSILDKLSERPLKLTSQHPLGEIIRRATDKEGERYKDARELLKDLERIVYPPPPPPAPSPPPERDWVMEFRQRLGPVLEARLKNGSVSNYSDLITSIREDRKMQYPGMSNGMRAALDKFLLERITDDGAWSAKVLTKYWPYPEKVPTDTLSEEYKQAQRKMSSILKTIKRDRPAARAEVSAVVRVVKAWGDPIGYEKWVPPLRK